MATSSVLLDRLDWQTGTGGAAGRFSRQPKSEEVRPVRRIPNYLVLAAAALLAAGCAGGSGEGQATGRAAASPATTAAPPETAATGGGTGGGGGRGGYGDQSRSTSSQGGASGGDAVRIADFAFTPATVRAKVGQKVRWEHQDAGVTHTVTALDGSFGSGGLHEGEAFTHVFRRAGSFAYRCSIHSAMRGTVKVAG
jgi:plastocyanin